MSIAPSYDLRYITRMDDRCWMVRVGLHTRHCRQDEFLDSEFGTKTKSLKAAKIYRDKEEERLKQKYNIRFDLGYNPNKESVFRNRHIKESGEYWFWIASVWEYALQKQHKKVYSINKYGSREAKRLAYQWRDTKRKEVRNRL